MKASTRHRLAWAIALGVDALQLGLIPITGSLSTWLNAPLDLAAMAILWTLTGWHLAYLPSLALELLPWVEVVPSWTAAVWLATRTRPKAEP